MHFVVASGVGGGGGGGGDKTTHWPCVWLIVVARIRLDARFVTYKVPVVDTQSGSVDATLRSVQATLGKTSLTEWQISGRLQFLLSK